MVNKAMMLALSEAIDKYGDLVYANGNKETLLKKGTEYKLIEGIKNGPQRIREALLKVGEILEEDENKKTIIALIPSGSMNASHALLVALYSENTVDIAAFFKEGLIKQHGARQAIDKVEQQLK